ncbi:MAG: hypothetical protein IKN72_10910 [Clostridia bacterium]|nr:hypothetical protein [Clostridia bacterium]
MKKLIALLCFVLLIATLVILPKPTQADAGTEPVDKRSEALKQRMETMEEDETVTVYIWFEDLDLGDVDAEAERLVGYTEKDIYDEVRAIPNFPSDIKENDPNFEELYSAYRENIREAQERTLEMGNHLRSTRNALVREAYAAYNQTNLETIELTLEELVYASYFSPMILANLTIEGIDRMQEIEEVLWLDYSEPQHPEPELEVAIPTVDADYVRDTEGYDGQGSAVSSVAGANH